MFSIAPILFMVLPVLWVRYYILHPKLVSITRGRALFSLWGVACDLCLIAQTVAVYWLLRTFLQPWTAFALFFLLSTIQQGVVLFDGLLYQKTGIRLEVSYLKFCTDIRSFWDSGKERGFMLFFPLILTFSLAQAALFIICGREGLRPNLFWLTALGVGGLITLTGLIRFSSRAVYSLAPALLLHQRYFTLKLLRKLRLKRSEPLSKEVFEPKGESFTKINEKYPLLKFTHGFKGEKRFSIAGDEKPNLIFLFWESCRAGDITSERCPNFSRLMSEGVYFSNFYSNSVKTSRSVIASLFGMPSDVDGSGICHQVDAPYISLAKLLGQNGYHSSYLHNGALRFENQKEFFGAHGYETIMGKDDILKYCPGAPETSWGVHDEYLMRYGLNYLAKEQAKPHFLTIFTISNHHPWRLPPGMQKQRPLSDETAHERYLQTLTYTDSSLGLFIEGLRRSGMSKNSILFIMGDHGHAMGEHGNNFNQQNGLYQENIHVPLLIWADGRIQEPQRIDDPASQVDLYPTAMDLLGIKGLNHAVGSSLVRKTDRKTIYFHNPYMYGFYGARRGKHKMIYTKGLSEVELYDLESDPEERVNIADRYPELVKQLLAGTTAYERGLLNVYDQKAISHSTFFDQLGHVQ